MNRIIVMIFLLFTVNFIREIILYIFMYSDSPSLKVFRRKLWLKFVKERTKRIWKVNTILAYPLVLYIELDPESKRLYIEEGFKAWSIDIKNEINYRADRFENAEKYKEEERKRIEEATKNSPLRGSYYPEEIIEIRKEMNNLKNLNNEN